MTAASSASDSTLRRSYALAGAVVALVAGFTLFRPPPTQGPYARDFEAYYAAGATWNAGGDPWSRAVWAFEREIPGVDATRDELLPYVGPAAALPLFGALARLPFSVAVRIWGGLTAAAFSALVLASLALVRTRRVEALLAAFALGIAFGPGISTFALGQVAMLSAAGIAGALVAFERRAVAAGAFATLLAGLQPNLALALIARMRDRVAVTCAVLAAAAFTALTLVAGGGVPGFLAYVHRLGEHGRAERFITIQHTPGAIAWALGMPEGAATALAAACAIAAVAVTVAATVRAGLDARDGTLLALAALPFAVPFFHEHDFVVELIPLYVLASTTLGRARVLTALAAVLVGVDWLGLAQRPAATAQIVAAAFALAFAFVVLGRGRTATRADLAPFVAVLALACVTIPLAHAHPAPTWPDRLPAGYRAPPSADASATWADEQRAAGLDERQPAWGALRALPLAGCIILGFTVVLNGRRRRD